MRRNVVFYTEPYPVHCKLPYVPSVNNDLVYLDERVRALEEARAYDRSRMIDLPQTYELILQGVQEQHLPRKINHQYVIDISNSEKPRLKLVHNDLACEPYYTWDDVLAERTRRSALSASEKKIPRELRRRWGNSNP